jgi:NAD(P)H-hydrate epimerase
MFKTRQIRQDVFAGFFVAPRYNKPPMKSPAIMGEGDLIKVVSVEKMRKIEAAADASGVNYDTMMQRAGRATADRAIAILSGLSNPRVTVLIGPGNNGGDGLVAGRFIAESGNIQVRFYLLQQRDEKDANFKAVQEADLFIAYAEDDRDQRVLRNMVASADLVIDALFGIGVRLPLRAEAGKVLRNVNQAINELRTAVDETLMVPTKPELTRRAAVPKVLAVDCPSGLDCDSGEIDKNAIHADETVTFIAAKPGLFIFPGAEAVGQLSITALGIPDDLSELQGETTVLADGAGVRDVLPPRPVNSHKGTFGKALVIAGSVNYTGAVALSAQAAYRVGAGLVTVGAPQPVVSVLAARVAEPTWLLLPHDMGVISEEAAKVLIAELPGSTAILLGPGMGREETTRAFLVKLLSQPAAPSEGAKHRPRRNIGFLSNSNLTTEADEQANGTLPPMVIDADGLNLLSEIEEWWKLVPRDTILTPHPGEMARLAKMDSAEVQGKRWEIARMKATEWGVVLVLKGAHTVVAVPDGRMTVLPFKTDALAKAGTGDVLAGAIVGLLAQGMAPYDAAVAGAYLHGLAGQTAGELLNNRSVLASDVLDSLAEAIEMVIS